MHSSSSDPFAPPSAASRNRLDEHSHSGWCSVDGTGLEVTPDMPAAALAAPNERLGGRFRLDERIGRGGVAEVFAATDERTGAEVAVKVLPRYGEHVAVTKERFEAETTLCRAVSHPNVCRLIACGHTEDGRPYLVTEALRGETLGQCLRREGTLSVDAVLRIARDAARGLGAIHRAGIVHRDVKPDNLFLCAGDRHDASVKVIDFGFAAPAGSAPEEPLKVFGTLRYTAPEQAIGEPVDARADIYALGIVIFRALTGELPFDACGDGDVIRHHLTSAVPPPSWLRDGIPSVVDALVAAMARKHPENRYRALACFCEDVERVLAGLDFQAPELRITPDRFEPTTELGWKVLRAIARIG
jgi:serine/threonine-protein kinase